LARAEHQTPQLSEGSRANGPSCGLERGERMPQVSTTLTPELVRELDALAAQQDVSRAELIRTLILEALDGRELDQGMRA
jgi:hypothetical protein